MPGRASEPNSGAPKTPRRHSGASHAAKFTQAAHTCLRGESGIHSSVPSRRDFLANSVAAGAGLVIGFHLPRVNWVDAAETLFAPNAFVRIAPDNTITIVSKHLEFGQGVYTGLATILAEELDADWSQIRVISAPSDPSRYNNLYWGQAQGTGNSSSIANSWEQLRRAGAAARAMLVAAAADAWRVPASEITASKGVLSHKATGRSTSYGALTVAAAAQQPPANVALKDPGAFNLIGTRVPRVDVAAKTDGSAIFALDVVREDMLTVLFARPPCFGGRVKSVDATAAKSIAGVVDVIAGSSRVAILGTSFWAAKKGRDALRVEWDDLVAEVRGSTELRAEYRRLLDRPGAIARKDGDAEGVLAGAGRIFAAEFEFPYLAHAPMEPLNCVVELAENRCRIWSGSQSQTIDHVIAARITGLDPGQIEINTTLAGGSFGRRADPEIINNAVSIAKAIGGRRPLRVVWTREDDIQGGQYRPLYLHRLRAALDETGRITAWHHRIVGQSITPGDGVDASSIQGAATLPYAIPNLSVELHTTQVGVPVMWWRSVGASHNAYATETLIDELAYAAHKDPVAFRLAMLDPGAGHAAVLRLAAEKADWGKAAPAGRFRGVAVQEWVGTYVAQVAELSLDARGMPKVERVVCAIDCGTLINPDIVTAQMEGGIAYGLGAALHNAITLTEGRVDQSNFHDYPSLRMSEMPRVEVHILPSNRPPTGVGEAGVPPIAPAVANALFAATGQRVRRLPFDGQSLSAR
jgi:isoquinoline 1-oxidoreductase subunit beta